MCKAFLEMYEDGLNEGLNKGKLEGKIEGKLEGKLEGRITAISKLLSNGGTEEDAIRFLEATEEELAAAKEKLGA